jgi:hypothetical protein
MFVDYPEIACYTAGAMPSQVKKLDCIVESSKG